MSIDYIPKQTFQFLKDVSKNNNRDWFNANKDKYVEAHSNLAEFAEVLLQKLKEHDNIENENGKKSIFRIYRDVRFSKDKSPYKNNLGGYFKRATNLLRGGYYFHVEPGACFVGGGFWGPSSADLKHIREQIALDPNAFRAVINSEGFKDVFGSLQGEQLKTAPKGFPKDHDAIDLLRYKQFLISKSFTDKEVSSPGYADKVLQTFFAMRPFFDYMSEVLTTNTNGELIV